MICEVINVQFLPNKTDIYIAALKSALLHRFGKALTASRADMLKRLWLCSAISNGSLGAHTDIQTVVFELSAAITARLLTKGYAVFIKSSRIESGIINRRALEALLCSIADKCKTEGTASFITIEQDNSFLKITAHIKGNEGYIKAAVRAMNGFIISIRKKLKTGIFIPITKPSPEESAAPVISSAEYITDPYSAVNLFLRRI